MPWTCAGLFHFKFDSAALESTETLPMTRTKAAQAHGASKVEDKFKLISQHTVEFFYFFCKKHHLLRAAVYCTSSSLSGFKKPPHVEPITVIQF